MFGEGFIGPDGQVPTIYTPSDPGAPHSAPRTLSFSHCTTTEVQQSCANDLWIHFSKFQTVVSFYAGLREGVGAFSGSVPLTVALYRSDQTQIGSGSTQDVGRGTQTKVSVDQHDYLPPCLVENPGCNDAPTIAFVHITAPDTAHAHDGLALDDFTLDDGGSTAPPDFGIGRVDATSPLNLPGGASRQATFQIGRFGGSSGGIDLSVLGLPTNVSASFTPSSYTGGSGGTVTMTLSAAANVQPFSGSITVVATPSGASAGPGPRSISVPLRVQAVYDLKNVTLIPAQAVGGVPSAGTNFSAEYDNSQTPMVAGRKTVVRLLAQAAGAPRGGATHVFAQLSGTRAGVPLPGSPLSPDRNDISVPDAPVSAQYADPANGFTFTLPPGWDAGSVNLRGQVFDRAPGSVILDDTRPAVQCASCTSNDAFTLTGVDFQLSNRLDISPVKVVWTRGGVTDVPGDVAKLTDAARATTPVADANWGVRSYQGIVDASDIAALPYLAGKDAKERRSTSTVTAATSRTARCGTWWRAGGGISTKRLASRTRRGSWSWV